MGYLKEKTWIMRFYDSEGTYIGNLAPIHFKNNPQFSIELNGGISELRMQAAHSFDDFNFPPDGILTAETFSIPPENYTGRTVLVQKGLQSVYDCLYVGNKMKLFYIRGEHEWQVWSGVYSGLQLRYSDGGREEFEHVFAPNTQLLATRVFRDGVNTTVFYEDEDSSQMLRDVIDYADAGLTYDSDSVKDTGTTRSYEFKVAYCLDALQSIITMTPYRWYWYVGGDDIVYLKNIDDENVIHNISAPHTIEMRFDKTIAFVRNRILFIGGGDPALFLEFESTGSQNAFGVYEQVITDTNVTDEATAEDIARRYLSEFSAGRNFFTVQISGDNFDLENIKPGDQLMLSTTNNLDFAFLSWGNFTWGADYWKYDFYAIAGIPGVIQRITHNFDSITCECAFNYEQFSQKIQSIQKQVDKINAETTPVAPS